MSDYNVMVDIETLSQYKTASVISIGAVKFTDDTIVDTFYTNIDAVDAAKRYGLHVSLETIEWWKTQKPEAYSATRLNRTDILNALNNFTDWYGKKSVPTWANGPDFDLVILENAFQKTGISVPWKFYHARCFRTFKNLFVDSNYKLEGVAHNALDDALFQTKYIQHILRKSK